MTKILNAVVDEGRNLTVTPSDGFAGEHNAEAIEIDVGPFASEAYDYFVLNFENFCAEGKLTSNKISTEHDEPAYIVDGVIYCPLTAELTASGKLKIQLEAHKTAERGEIIKKSSVAELEFKPSVMGEDDMMNAGNTVHARLDEVERDVESLEGRVTEIENQKYGDKIKAAEEKAQSAQAEADTVKEKLGKIQSDTAQLKNKTSVLEMFSDNLKSRVGILENTSGKTVAEVRSLETELSGWDGKIEMIEDDLKLAKKQLTTVDGYKIPENFADLKGRVEALEDKPDALGAVPLASNTTVGGFKLGNLAPFTLDENGSPVMKYENLNPHPVIAIIALALLTENGVVETATSDTVESIASFVYDTSLNIAMDTLQAVAFSAFSSGQLEYMNENYEIKTLNVDENHVYVIAKKDGAVVVDDYFGKDLRRLITEGI